jgi:YHS domain-containing protein
MALALTAAPAFGQMSCCASSGNAASSSSGGLSGLKLVSLAGDTVDFSQHVGSMPMVLLLANTDPASGRAADAVRAAAVAAGDRGPMFAIVLGAGTKSAQAFAKAHKLTGMVLVDPGHAAQTAAMADTAPVVMFLDRSGTIVQAEAMVTEATVTEGVKALAQTEQKLVDPVCGMTVTKETAAGTYVYKGQTYYFCSKACQDNFTKDPQKYLSN